MHCFQTVALSLAGWPANKATNFVFAHLGLSAIICTISASDKHLPNEVENAWSRKINT